MNVNGIYPWQNQVWQRVLADKSKLHHALLLKGPVGIGKLDFAIFLTKSLLCESPTTESYACGNCPSCGWFDQDNHPDFRFVVPEQESDKEEEGSKSKKKKTQIVIEQIRGLGDFVSLSSHKSNGQRIVLLHPSEMLNQASGNALLKMLEEPPPGVMFILVAHQPQKILPTIMSRCQKIDMPIPSNQKALDWMITQGIQNPSLILNYAGGAPLQAINDNEETIFKSLDVCQQLKTGAKIDVFQTSAICAELGMENAINTIQKFCYDLLLAKMTSQVRYHTEQASIIRKLSASISLVAVLDFFKRLEEAKKTASHPLNNELQLNRLLHHYTQIFIQ